MATLFSGKWGEISFLWAAIDANWCDWFWEKGKKNLKRIMVRDGMGVKNWWGLKLHLISLVVEPIHVDLDAIPTPLHDPFPYLYGKKPVPFHASLHLVRSYTNEVRRAGNSPSMDYLSRISSVGFKGQRNWWWEMAARSNLVRNKDETVVNDVCLKDNQKTFIIPVWSLKKNSLSNNI